MIDIDIPTSKSYVQRAIICASLCCTKDFVLRNITMSEDVISCINAMKGLGAKIVIYDGNINDKLKDIHIYEPIKLSDTFDETIIDVGESGTTCRILLPILASLERHYYVNGSGSLINRDLSEFKTIFEKYPIYYKMLNDKNLPIKLYGRFDKSNDIVLNTIKSSQYISGILIAYSYNKRPLHLIVKNCPSYGYVNITIDILKQFGIDIDVIQCENSYIELNINSSDGLVCPQKIDIEKDWSSFGAIYLAASLIGYDDVRIKGLNIYSSQPDRKIWDLAIEQKDHNVVSEDINTIIIKHINEIKPFDIDISTYPDLFPYFAGLAAICPSECKISGIDRLVNKESDRGKAIYNEFKKLGINCHIEGNAIYIKKGEINDLPYNSYNDHRIGQTLAIIKLLANGHIKNNDSCINKSYPNFIKDIEKIYGKQIRTFI